MKNIVVANAGLVLVVGMTGCSSSAGMGVLGGVLGAGAASGGYECHLKQQKDRVEVDFNTGKVDWKKYEIHKGQIS